MKTKYAIKVMLSADDWIYVTENNDSTMFELRPMLFNTRQAAEEHANIWGNKNVAKVVRWRKEL